MELRQFYYFVQLAKRKNVSQTADFLCISQPALSKSLASLENELGVSLFDRHGKQLTLSDRGNQFYQYAVDILDTINDGINAAQGHNIDPKNIIRIQSVVSHAAIMLPIVQFQIENSQYFIDQKRYREDLLRKKKPDFIICTDLEDIREFYEAQGWVKEHIGTGNFGIVYRDDSIWRPPYDDWKGVWIQDFENANFITVSSASETDNGIVKLCRSVGFYPKVYCSSDNLLYRLDVADRKLGVTVVTDNHKDDIEKMYPHLKYHPLLNDKAYYNIYLLHTDEKQMSDACLRFLKYYITYLRNKV